MYERHIFNSVGILLLLLTHVTIQVVYCHHMLTPCVEHSWYVKFWHLCLKQDQLIEGTTKRQAMAPRINILQYNRFVFKQRWSSSWKKLGPYTQWVLQHASKLVGRWNADRFQNFSNSFQVKLFTSFNISAVLLKW